MFDVLLVMLSNPRDPFPNMIDRNMLEELFITSPIMVEGSIALELPSQLSNPLEWDSGVH